MNIAIYISAFLLGIGGSLHCLGMCGPLVMAVPFAQGKYRYMSMLIYLLGKSIAYASLGLIAGAFGAAFFLLKWQQALSITAGILVIAMALYPLLKPRLGYNWVNKAIATILKKMMAAPGWHHYLFLGYLNGLLPCGLLYVALTTAVVAGNITGGALVMFVFGIGTMPILLAAMLLKTKLAKNGLHYFRRVSIIISVAVGLLLVLRGLNLNIPYISPHANHHKKDVVSCCVNPH